jgi:hypothetical protein
MALDERIFYFITAAAIRLLSEELLREIQRRNRLRKGRKGQWMEIRKK